MQGPQYAKDLFSDEVIADPYPHYKNLRDLGAAVWLPHQEIWALSRFEDVRCALRGPEIYSSAQGFGLNDIFNGVMSGSSICSDPPEHAKLRQVLSGPMQPYEIASLKDRIDTIAETLIEKLVAQRSFDGVSELARFLPITIVSELVGLPENGRAEMLAYAAAGFDATGPLNARATAAFPKIAELVAFTEDATTVEKVKPGSFTAGIYKAAEEGKIDPKHVKAMILEYVFPSLDTTINSTSAALLLFARNPDQWDLLRSDPRLIPSAIDEVVRIESPIRHFSRVLTRDVDLDGVTMRQGQRVLVIYASANRDERQWENPEQFNILRSKLGLHVGFGAGPHTCGGMHLAKMEITALLEALIARVKRFEIAGEPKYIRNNILRGLESLPLTVT